MELGIFASDDSANDRYVYLRSPIQKKYTVPCSNVYWIDAAVPLERFLELKSYQVPVPIYPCSDASESPCDNSFLSRGLITFQAWERSAERTLWHATCRGTEHHHLEK